MNSEPIKLPFVGPVRPWTALIGCLFLISTIRVVVIVLGPVELSADEAQYWEWSRRLDWCYMTKPPGVALLIRIGTMIFGHTALGVRSWAIVLSLLSSVCLYRLGTLLYPPAVGLCAALLLQAIPLFSAYGLGMTPDTPLLFFWCWGLLLFVLAFETQRSQWWILLSLCLGLGLLCKGAMIYFHVCMVVFLVVDANRRKRLYDLKMWGALIGSLLFLAPVVIWNWQNDWVMFRHDAVHAHGNEGFQISLPDCINYLGSQLGAITPVVLVLVVVALIRHRRRCALCFWFSVPILVFFVVKSLQSKVQGNWAMVGYISALFPVCAWCLEQWKRFHRSMKNTVILGLGLSVFISSLPHCPWILFHTPVVQRVGSLKKLTGWRQLGQQVSGLSGDVNEPFFIVSNSYQVAAELAFYMESHPVTYCLYTEGRRMNQYDLWPGFEDRIGWNALYVTESPDPGFCTAFLDNKSHEVVITDPAGESLRKYIIYELHHFKGSKRIIPKRY